MTAEAQERPLDMRSVLAELTLRRNEGLALYRPMDGQQIAFHRSMASERLIRGGNRSGKSTSAAAEVASAATGRALIGPDGQPVPHKFPTDRPLMIWVIGLGERHIGDTFYRLLFQPGAFKIIKDQATGEWRAWRPWESADKARESETKPGPPLIPHRMVKDSVWAKAGAKQFESVTLTNGTRICAFVSTGEVKVGDPVDLIWIDERIQYPQYVAEWQARLSDRKGRLIWSTWPETSNFALLEMSQRAKEDEKLVTPDVAEFKLTFSANPYIDEDEKRKRRKAWGRDRKELLARDMGEFVNDHLLMYPEFSEDIHSSPRPFLPDDKIDEVLRKRGYQPPDDWTRYAFLDPGHSTCAVLFVAVPPPSDFGDHVVVYDELYLHGATADSVAKSVYEKIAGYVIEKFVIDHHYGAHSISGGGLTIRQLYSKAFYNAGINAIQTGNSFQYSFSEIAPGVEAVRSWLVMRPNGTAKMRVIAHRCPNFLHEIRLYKKKMTMNGVDDKPASNQDDHLMDCLRYAAADGCGFVPVNTSLKTTDPGPHYRAYREMMSQWPGGEQEETNRGWSFGPGLALN